MDALTAPSRRLDALPTRPPTPPRESITGSRKRAALEDLSNSSSPLPSSAAFTLTPPDQSPSPSVAAAPMTAEKTRKRVEWSPWTNYHKAPTFATATFPQLQASLKPLPPSRDRKCSRSILKPFDPTASPTLAPATKSSGLSAPLDTMLESATKQLAGPTRTARIDAYLALSGALKYFDPLASSRALVAKMDIFMQFIRRDLLATMPTYGGIDTNLILQALKLLVIFLSTPPMAAHLDDDFRAFLLDHATAVLGDGHAPKMLITHYMHVLSLQEFAPKVMTPDRASHIIARLAVVDGHVKGNAIVGERILIFHRLLRQVPGVMAARPESWMSHLWAALLSPLKEVRSRAIAFGIQVGIDLGNVGQVSRTLKDMFNRRQGDDILLAEVQRRLEVLIAAREDAPHVPQIWSVAVLLLRSRSQELEHWAHMKPWLLIIQKCFNSTDVATKHQANLAWSRLIFAIHPNLDTSLSMVKMLRQPIIGQLDRKTTDRQPRSARPVALSSLCTLLYYALRPAPTSAHLDVYWEQYVSHVVGRSLLGGAADVEYGCNLLTHLLDCTASKPWSDNRANEAGAIRPEELPALDPKWVRSHAPAVLATLEIALHKAAASSISPAETTVGKMWQRFVDTLVLASSKEIKISYDQMSALAHILNLLERLWSEGLTIVTPSADVATAEDQFYARFGFLVRSTLEGFGARCWTDQLLTRNANGVLEAVDSAAHRSCKPSQKALRAPILHFVEMYRRSPTTLSATPRKIEVLQCAIQTCLRSRDSISAQMQLLHEAARVLSVDDDSQTIASAGWQMLSELGRAKLAQVGIEQVHHLREPTDLTWASAVGILECVSGAEDTHVLSSWMTLCTSLIDAASKLSSYHTVHKIVTLLAESLGQRGKADPTCSSMAYLSHLIRSIPAGFDTSPLKKGRTSLTAESPMLDPFTRLLQVMDEAVKRSYDLLQPGDVLPASAASPALTLLSSVTMFIGSRDGPMVLSTLKHLQGGIGVWIEDDDRKLGRKSSGTHGLRRTVMDLWTAIATVMERVLPRTSETLELLAPLITSALRSRRKVMVRKAVHVWNHVFGSEYALQYPERVADALQRLRPIFDLQLPNFPVDTERQPFDIPLFSDVSDEEMLSARSKAQPIAGSSPASGPPEAPSSRRSISAQPAQPVRRSARQRRARIESPEPERHRISKRQATSEEVRTARCLHEGHPDSGMDGRQSPRDDLPGEGASPTQEVPPVEGVPAVRVDMADEVVEIFVDALSSPRHSPAPPSPLVHAVPASSKKRKRRSSSTGREHPPRRKSSRLSQAISSYVSSTSEGPDISFVENSQPSTASEAGREMAQPMVFDLETGAKHDEIVLEGAMAITAPEASLVALEVTEGLEAAMTSEPETSAMLVPSSPPLDEETGRDRATTQRIIATLQEALHDVQQVDLAAEAVRQVDDLLFFIRRAVFQGGRMEEH
ncbi:MAG: hypothetical protein M1838_000332 [Thelocarpon superellum]|nr:MAG: hypothetical protein M1838_000332 [Thelocarpon superellum]